VEFSTSQKEEWLSDIRFLPQAIENAILNLDESQLQTPYRVGGWTVHQLVHHIADSHMNAYCRFKLGFTEDNPIVKAYDENAWVKTNDVKVLPVNISITLLYALHQRWYEFLLSISDEQWNRTVIHSANQKILTLWHLLGMYSWHSRHHTAHITSLRERMNWY
jgi:uncharacterized damage-inducible protein DinB